MAGRWRTGAELIATDVICKLCFALETRDRGERAAFGSGAELFGETTVLSSGFDRLPLVWGAEAVDFDCGFDIATGVKLFRAAGPSVLERVGRDIDRLARFGVAVFRVALLLLEGLEPATLSASGLENPFSITFTQDQGYFCQTQKSPMLHKHGKYLPSH